MGGASSKTIFTGIVKKILTEDVDATNNEFWDELWKTTLTVEEIFELVQPDDVRKLISDHPNNLKIMVTQAVAQLYQVVETPYPIYFDQALNCARILSRLLPFLLESKSKVVRDMLWSRSFMNKPSQSNESEGNNLHDSEPLAVILVNTLFHLLFLPDFTIEDPNIEFNESDVNTKEFKTALMWAPGVGSTEKAVTNSTQFDSNRVDILRVMIAAFCDSLYQSADGYDSCASLWLEVATSVDAPYAEIVFYSLINTVLGYDPIGWGLPYGNIVSTDTAKAVMESAVHALIILLDYGHPISTPESIAAATTVVEDGGVPLPSVSPTDTDAQGFNVFRRLLGSIESADQLNFMYRGFVRLLNNVHQAESTYLPYSITRIGIEQELLILFWKCLEENPRFLPYIMKHCDVTEILVPICYFMLEGRRDPAKVGLMYLCTFTLLKLSGERSFGVSLNKHYQLQLPVDIPLFSGNHADLLIIVLHKLIVSGLEKLSALYSCFLTIICNVSPYCKSFGSAAAVKLVNLLQLFVSPRFLYASEGNHIYVGMLLETLNNIVQYQYEGNGHVIYSIIRRKEIFDGIANLTLPTAIRSVNELLEKRNVAATVAAAAKAKKSPAGRSSNDSASEDNEQLHATAAPTELISTSNIERRVGNAGDIVDMKTGGSPVGTRAATTRSASGGDAKESELTTTTTELQVADTARATSVAGWNGSQNGTTSQRFLPNEAWLQALKADLPLNTIMRLLKHLVPQVEELANKNAGVDEKAVVDFLKSTTMVGLLPVPHPIVIRKYQPNKFTCLWFTAFQWGVIFMHNQNISLFDGKNVKLFIVQTV